MMVRLDRERFRRALEQIKENEGGISARMISSMIGYEASYLSQSLNDGKIAKRCLLMLEEYYGMKWEDVALDVKPARTRTELEKTILQVGKDICDRLDTLIGLCQGETVRQLMEDAVAAGSTRAAEQERERKRNLMRSGAD